MKRAEIRKVKRATERQSLLRQPETDRKVREEEVRDAAPNEGPIERVQQERVVDEKTMREMRAVAPEETRKHCNIQEKCQAEELRLHLQEVFQGQIRVECPVAQVGGTSGSFNRAAEAWQKLPGVDPRVVCWLTDGVNEKPGPACTPRPCNLWGGAEFNVTDGEEQARWLRDEHQRWLAAGISEEVSPDDRDGFWHPLKVVPKAGWETLPLEKQWQKKYRLCLAVAKTLNESLTVPRLRMETLAMALRLVEEGDCLVVGDLDSGYNHMLLHPECRRYYRYRVDGRSFQMRVLFFGLASAPYIFSTTVAQFWKFLRMPQTNVADSLDVKRDGLRVTGFIDDLMILERRLRMAEVLSRWVWPVSGALGFCWGAKSQWEPRCQGKYLGLIVDTECLEVRLPAAKAKQLRQGATYALRRSTLQVLTVLRLVGRLRAGMLAIPYAQVLAWELGRLVAPVVRDFFPDGTLPPQVVRLMWQGVLRTKVEMTDGARRALFWIKDNLSESRGRRWTDDNLQWLVVDASTDRAGAKLGALKASIPFSEEVVQRLHGNQSRREVNGALVALQAFREQLQGQRVALVSDNQGQVAIFNHMRNRMLAPWVAEALWFCVDNNIDLHKACWIPSREMVRRGVDGLSRLRDVNDWGLRPEIWDVIQGWAPGLEVDRFADSLNAKLPRWNSRFHEPRAEAIDALSQNWVGVRNYACPPLSLVGRVLDLVRTQKAATVLVVPKWRSQIWWPVLLRLAPSGEQWIDLGEGRELFVVGRSGTAAPLRHNWQFMAVKLFWT